ncbi:MAG: hypothetical protein RLN60_03940 [Phycisphaerales bacterium]
MTVAINMGTGEITTIGSLDQGLTEIGGLDVGPDEVIYGAFQPEAVNESHLFTLDPNDGSSDDRGVISGGIELKSLAVVPAPGATALAALGGIAMVRRRRG